MALGLLRRLFAPRTVTHSQEPSFYRTSLSERLYGGQQRDIEAECGYPASVTALEFRRWYETSGIARRIVECWPDATWQVEPEVYETEEPEQTAFERGIADIAEAIGLWDILRCADVLSGIGRYGVLLLGFDDGAPLSEPLPEDAECRLLYVRAYDETYAEIVERETDPHSARYGMPTAYRLRFVDVATGAETAQRVHWSRCIHIADGRDVSMVYGTPRLQPVIHRLYDLRKLLSGSAEMYWRGAFPGYSFEVLPEFAGKFQTEDERERTRDHIESWFLGLRRYMALSGMTARSLAPQVVDPTAQIDAQLRAIAVSLAIPWRILYGSEQAQLASEQDTMNWARRVRGRQYGFATRCLVKPVIDALVRAGAVDPPTGTVRVHWPDVTTTPPQVQAQIGAQLTSAIGQYVQLGVDQLIDPRAYMVHILGMAPEVTDALLESTTDDDTTTPEQGTSDATRP